MPPYPMTRCTSCDSTIKQADIYHREAVTVTGMPVGWETGLYRLYDHARSEHVYLRLLESSYAVWCCECMNHEVGDCVEEMNRIAFNREFKKAIVRSLVGVAPQGFLD